MTLPLFNRRRLLFQGGGGFACLALSQMLGRDSKLGAAERGQYADGFPVRHHVPKVKRVIQLFMTGGASPMDLFDYKPALARLHGQMLGPKEKPEGFTAPAGAIMKSPFAFAKHGDSGRWVSSLFPEQAKLVDEMAFLMAMTTKTNVHGPGTYMMNSGFLLPGFPCMGAWISYALGNLTDELPTFVVLPDARGLPYNQKGCFSPGFLPPVHEGIVIDATSRPAIPDLFPSDDSRSPTRRRIKTGWTCSSTWMNGWPRCIPTSRGLKPASPAMN